MTQLDLREAIRDEISKYKESLAPGAWGAIVGYYRSWESDRADVSALNAMLQECKRSLDKQNEK